MAMEVIEWSEGIKTMSDEDPSRMLLIPLEFRFLYVFNLKL